MDAEIGFFHQHVRRFLDADVVAVGQVLAKTPLNELSTKMTCTWPSKSWTATTSSQKVVAAAPSTALAGTTRLASTWPSVSVSTSRLQPLTS